MIFIETAIFTKIITDILPDTSYRVLQHTLLLRPETGKIIPGSGGLRKIRWGLDRHGKRGGIRIIYYWDVSQDTIYMLLAFKKNQQEDLTPEQLRFLRDLIKEWLA